jgi:squalene-hopene/tetraprenyl-beta-curcumene cyclase
MRILSFLFVLCFAYQAVAQTTPTTSTPTVPTPTTAKKWPLDPQLVEAAKSAINKGIHFLREQQSKDDGSYGQHVGLTAMVLSAMAGSYRKYRNDDGPFMSRASAWLTSQAKADGSITGDGTPGYNTSLSIIALHQIDAQKYQKEIKAGQLWLVGTQSDEDHQYTRKDKYYGGIGYGNDERPDLSNLQYALEALKKTEFDPKSDVWEKAALFVKRSQNFTEENSKDELEQKWIGNDGGFIYEPGASMAGGTTSYGSMTFAGLKSLIFAQGLKKDDARVKAALNWIAQNYDFNTHPGMGNTAYYYYLQTAASALEAYGEPLIKGAGQDRNWGEDILNKLINLQKTDGSWINENRKYWEGNPILVTARAVISINHVLNAAGVQ